jgi:hypothetical protein
MKQIYIHISSTESVSLKIVNIIHSQFFQFKAFNIKLYVCFQIHGGLSVPFLMFHVKKTYYVHNNKFELINDYWSGRDII